MFIFYFTFESFVKCNVMLGGSAKNKSLANQVFKSYETNLQYLFGVEKLLGVWASLVNTFCYFGNYFPLVKKQYVALAGGILGVTTGNPTFSYQVTHS